MPAFPVAWRSKIHAGAEYELPRRHPYILVVNPELVGARHLEIACIEKVAHVDPEINLPVCDWQS